MPWRYKNGEKPNPYHVWLSEIMCQQTTVQAVKEYYTKFLSTWPTIEDLANADNDDVMAAWAGLGYYARARNLHKCAKIITNECNGKFPDNQKDLQALPGVGDYTSAAIATIAFNQPATVMDGNIERIMARFFSIEDALPKAKPTFKAYTQEFFKEFEERPGDFAQALMDIGATICTPKKPKCLLCPLNQGCEAKKHGVQESLPKKAKKKQRPHKFGHVYWIENDKGEVLFHKRPEKGLLAGMSALPTSSWGADKSDIIHLDEFKKIDFEHLNATTHHVFTHFDLTFDLHKSCVNQDIVANKGYFWADPDSMAQKLPTVFKKPFVKFMIK